MLILTAILIGSLGRVKAPNATNAGLRGFDPFRYKVGFKEFRLALA